MAPEIYCGPYQPSLENAFIGALKADPPALGRRVAVVSPSRQMSDRVQRLVAERGLALLNVRFHTFYSLAREVAETSGEPVPAVVADELFHDKVIDRILRKLRKEVRLPRGLAAACRASLRDLTEAGVDPAQFREHFPALLADPAQKTAFDFLLALQDAYSAELNALGLMPMSGLEVLATRLIESGRAPALEDYARLLYYGFYDLNGVQADFFAAVSKARPSAVFFPYRKDHPAFRFVERFHQLKLGGGGKPLPPDSASRALGGALDALFDPAAPAKKTKSLKVFNVSGARDEVWKAAKEILRLHERPEDPVPFGEMGFVARGLRDYRGAVEEVFREHGIPFSLLSPDPLLRHPAAKLSLLLLTLARRDFPAATVLDIVESPYFRMDRFAAAGPADELRAEWRRLIEHTGVHSGWRQWKAKIEPWAKEDLELFPHLVAEGRAGRKVPAPRTAALWGWLDGLRKRLGGAEAGWKERADAALAVLSENFAVPADEPGLGGEAWARVRAGLEELRLYDLLGEKADAALFLETFEEKLGRDSLDPPPPARDAVRVLGAMDARGESFRVVFLAGLCEGVFPRQVREDPLLRDSVRALLQQPAGYWILPKMAGYDEEKLLFYHLAASASEAVYALYTRSDDAGKARTPSIYLRELCRAAGLALESPEENERVPRQPFAKLDALEPPLLLSPKETSLLVARDGERAGDFLPPAEADLLTDGLKRLGEMRRPGEPHAMDGLVGPPEDYLKQLRAKGLSPTALDDFGTCPFKFYAGRVLGLKDPDESRDMGELDARLKGQIYHLVFQRFHEGLVAQGYWKTRGGEAVWKPVLEKALDGVFGDFGWRSLGLYPVLWESLKEQMSRHARRLAAFDMSELERSGFVPSVFEEPFRAPAPLGLTGPLAEIGFNGRPDRVDVGAGAFRVVDYKTRWRRDALEKEVLKARAHQPAVYLEILSASPRFAGLSAAGTAYFAVEDSPETNGRPWRHEYGAAEWKAAREAVRRNMAGFLRQIQRGEFIILPDDGQHGHCKHCDFAMACRKAHAPSRRRAEESELRRRFDSLLDGAGDGQ